MTARATISCSSPADVSTRSTNGAASRPSVRSLSTPRRLTSRTRVPSRRDGWISASAASGSRYSSTSSRPVGKSSGSGIVHPAFVSIVTAVGSTL